MFEGLYNTASGMVTQGKIQELISTNIAKAVVPGYKRLNAVVQPFERELNVSLKDARLNNAQVGGSLIDSYHTVFEQGNMKQTDNPLDFCIEGKGFFTVVANNKEYYTRNGRFSISEEGELVTPDGCIVAGENGPIKILNDDNANPAIISKLSVSETGDIFIHQGGKNAGEKIGKLKIVDFEDPAKLSSLGQSLFSANGEKPQVLERPVVAQGYIEESNVNILDEMVSMMANMRIYETNQKMMSNMSNAFSRSINEIGRVT